MERVETVAASAWTSKTATAVLVDGDMFYRSMRKRVLLVARSGAVRLAGQTRLKCFCKRKVAFSGTFKMLSAVAEERCVPEFRIVSYICDNSLVIEASSVSILCILLNFWRCMGC